jgi:hypothetical protein
MMVEDIAQRAHDMILRNGGITIDLRGHEPDKGYAYSPYPELERVLPAQGLTPEHVTQYMHDNERALSMPDHYLGAWHDQESGNVFLDISKVGPAHPDTVQEAAKNNQLAVFDLSNFNEIPTGVTRSRDVTSFKQSSEWEDLFGIEEPAWDWPQHPKHITTEDDHERGKIAWGLPVPHNPQPWQLKTSKVDHEWMHRWIEKNGPFMKHRTSEHVVDKIRAEGLIPHDQGPGSKYQYELVPRANHSYLTYASPISYTKIYHDSNTIWVDLRKLDWNRINADEDSAFDADRDNWPGQFWPKKIPYAETIGGRLQPDGTTHHVHDETGRSYPHWGAWADHHQLNEPHHTAHSLNTYSTIAVEGGVDPAAMVDAAEVEREMMRLNMYGKAIPDKVPYVIPSHLWPEPAKPKPVNPTQLSFPLSYTREGSKRHNLTFEKTGEWHDGFEPGFYHAAPTTERERIRTHGLQPSDPYHNPMYEWNIRAIERAYPDIDVRKQLAPGLYMTPDQESARMHGREHFNEYDLWYIPASQVHDPVRDQDWKNVGREGYRVQHPVDAHLFEGPEHRWADDMNRWQDKWVSRTAAEIDEYGDDIAGKVERHEPGTHNAWKDLDSQDNGISTEKDETCQDWDTDEWRWEDEGGAVKQSARSVHYHVTPARNRESIEQHGLRVWDGPSPYLWLLDSEELAHQVAAKPWGGSRENDVWAVDTSGLELQPDPHPGIEGMRDRSWVSGVPVPPERLSRLPRAPGRPTSHARAPLTELVHALGLSEWDRDSLHTACSDRWCVVSGAYALCPSSTSSARRMVETSNRSSRPSFKEFLSCESTLDAKSPRQTNLSRASPID